MMKNIREKFAFFFVLIANLVLLAHSIIPHHHDEVVVEGTIECIHHDKGSNHGNLPVCERDHKKSEPPHCGVSSAILLPNNQFRLNSFSGQISSPDIFLVSFYKSSLSVLPNRAGFQIKLTPDQSLPSSLLGSALGLRAPPVC